ncbi:MAG: hypothetical protein Q7J84_03890 [Sulfuricaulis sp.]|nr:hypothetical protein [Sulfuricaulis sp.]
MLRWLAAFSRQDWIILTGLLLLAGGLVIVNLAAALIVPGALLFLVGVGVFIPKEGKP